MTISSVQPSVGILRPLLLSQAHNAGSDPRGRRWPKDMISICLQLYNRSPLGYNSLRDSGILILPSSSLLILYKNSVHQQVGFHTSRSVTMSFVALGISFVMSPAVTFLVLGSRFI
jgi:hypothetical protein